MASASDLTETALQIAATRFSCLYGSIYRSNDGCVTPNLSDGSLYKMVIGS